MPKIQLSEEVKFYFTGSETLLIWFGGINEPHFSDELSKLTDFDMLTVRDAKNSWYTQGLISSHESFTDALNDLSQLIQDFKYQKLCFCGQSSGGYGALFYAHFLKADLCIVFSPQTRNFFNGQCHMTPHIKLTDLSQLYADNKKTQIVFNLARSEDDHSDNFFWDDWRQVEKFKNFNNSTFISHPYDNHSVSVSLKEKGLLYKFVKSLTMCYLK